MPFPEVKRVKYNKSPLDKVICQLRFPPILAIDSQPPYEFQEKIREQFPNYIEKMEVQQEIDAVINVGLSNEIINPMSKVTTNKNHEFTTENGEWSINLTRTFISISTSNYETWENFIDKFEKPLEALKEIYKPAYFTRAGLRYIDIFCRSKLGLEKFKWNELIHPYFLGLLGSSVGNNVSEYNSVSEVKCDDNSSIIRIMTGLVRKVGSEEVCFLMDSDAFTSTRVNKGEEQNKLSYLHDRSSRLVRYAITDILHKGMEPENYE